jgi:ATP-dependent helicase/nuclease subunit B
MTTVGVRGGRADAGRPAVRLYVSAASDDRLAEALRILLSVPTGVEALVVAPSRGAADDLVRAASRPRGASFGWHRFSILQLAARLALPALAADGRLPSSGLGAEVVSARAIFRAVAEGGLDYFAPVARTPGFPRAVARTLGELRLAGVGLRVADLGPHGSDLARLMRQTARELLEAGAADHALLLETATRAAVERSPAAGALVVGRPLLLIDPVAWSPAEGRFLAALAGLASETTVTLPEGDEATRRILDSFLSTEVVAARSEVTTTLGRLRARLFTVEVPPPGPEGDDVQLFSAPGEAREAVEIARRLLEEARRGVVFDQMAVLVRAPHQYLGLLEHALARASIPAWFDRGTRRPDPAGRALLALLFCAEEGLSARRFAEYLSLAQVPDPDRPDSPASAAPDDETLAAGLATAEPEEIPPLPLLDAAGPDRPVVDGALRAPWRWESLLVESAVIGGRDRWVSRLDGLDEEYRRRLAELNADEPAAPRASALARDREHLGHLRAFALPIIGELDAWREAAWPWGEWLDRLERLSPRVLRQPARALRVLAELRPMAEVGPVGIGEVRKVLTDRLRMLAVEPPARRFGRLFVGSPDQARGRAFRVVFVPGLAERIFPQKLREDPLLVDDLRRALDAGLAGRDERTLQERLQLRLAVGAATERLYLSYPRLDVGEARPRVPSFYALDVKRALTGRIPSHEELERQAYERGGATLAWPAPSHPASAIDALEHDLAVLRRLLDGRDAASVRGRARYLLELNACLGRSVRERWARHRRQWSDADGLTKVTDPIRPALDAQRLGARPYSLSALQHYASCPYRFLLSAIYRLAPREDAIAIQRLDPLTKGSLFHRVQAEFLRALRDRDRLPIRPATLAAALETLAETLARVAGEERARLAPAIPRVWEDEIAAIERDLGRWVQLMADDKDGWVPQWFEFAFGLPHDESRDPASLPAPVVLDGRFTLRGSIDLVERHPVGALRVTDHKTGRARWPERMIVAGGEVLQPVLYSLVLEAATRGPVYGGRLSFCTTAGEFRIIDVPLTDTTRRVGLEVLEIIDRAVEHGTLAPYPKAGACGWCDFKPVCGPNEERRTRDKPVGKFADLDALREQS